MQVKVRQLCGKLAPVTYTCSQCKREVCEACFKHEANVCSECYSRLRGETPLLTFPLKLFLLGFALIFLGMIFLIASSILYGNVQTTTGIVIFVGPIPIILGTGPHSVFAILLATILTVLGIVFFLLLRK
ncbi:MAG: DUF131 domain-containing protein [Candidatus Bathyarchaeota archaeon]|nr:DUF131 domain-containing protein [Candidatus Bathyarchaeota archaeon]